MLQSSKFILNHKSMESEKQPISLSGDEAEMLIKLFPEPGQMGGRHLNVGHVTAESDSKVRELERRGVLMFLKEDPGTNPANAGWFLTDEGLEALKDAEKN